MFWFIKRKGEKELFEKGSWLEWQRYKTFIDAVDVHYFKQATRRQTVKNMNSVCA